MTDHETELIDVEHEQSLEATVATLRALADSLENADEELTVEYGDQSATVPAPAGEVEFELELEREGQEDDIEYELEIELEWDEPADAAEMANESASDEGGNLSVE